MSTAVRKTARMATTAEVAVPDREVRNVEREAYAVESEAFALERECGGFPFVESSLQELMAAAWAMAEAEEDELESTVAGWQDLLNAARLTQHFCTALQRRLESKEHERFLNEWTPIITDFCQQVEQQITPPAARKRRKAGSAPGNAE